MNSAVEDEVVDVRPVSIRGGAATLHKHGVEPATLERIADHRCGTAGTAPPHGSAGRLVRPALRRLPELRRRQTPCPHIRELVGHDRVLAARTRPRAKTRRGWGRGPSFRHDLVNPPSANRLSCGGEQPTPDTPKERSQDEEGAEVANKSSVDAGNT
jgi:hypothetical protein